MDLAKQQEITNERITNLSQQIDVLYKMIECLNINLQLLELDRAQTTKH